MKWTKETATVFIQSINKKKLNHDFTFMSASLYLGLSMKEAMSL